MTDNVVIRLRSKSPYLSGSSAERTMEEAADEIERLRKTLTYISEHGDRPADQLALEALFALEGKMTPQSNQEQELTKRLRGENWWLNVTGEEAADEIERLQAALTYISQLDDDGEAPGLARRALEPKP